MSFANPNLLYFLLLGPLLIIIFILSERNRKRNVTAMIQSNRPSLVMGAAFERRLVYLILLVLGVSFLVAAAARPQWGAKMEELTAKGFDILLAVDVSESMRAQDVSPDRISKARQEVDKLLGLLEGDRVGLIAFAGSAFSYTPLTVDYSAIRMFLSSLEPGAVSDAGTDLSAAVNEAIRTFDRNKSTAKKVLVIFSDGEHHEEDPLPAVLKAKEAGIQIFTIGIGNVTKSGERIPYVSDTGEVSYKKDQQGRLIITKLDETTLTTLAENGDGAYYRVSEAGTELVEIYRSLQNHEETEFSARRQNQKIDRYQHFLLGALILLVVAYSLSNRSFKKLRRTQGVLS